MKILFAFNAMKGALSAAEACDAAAAAATALGHETRVCPIADGGDGTCAVLSAALQCVPVNVGVIDPLGRTHVVRYGWHFPSKTAVMDMAVASGIALLRPADRDVLRATTYGTGQMIAHAIVQKKARRVILGLGGSATVDGGLGAVQALGWKFTDAAGVAIADGAGAADLVRVSGAFVPVGEAALSNGVQIDLLCDVRNPLLGQVGAAAVFGPQKGASPSQVEFLENALYHWMISVLHRPDVAQVAGAGAAGGLAAGLMACCGGRLADGARLTAELTGLEAAVQWADEVVTGEGCLDNQTLMGKAPAEVARLARAHGKPLTVMAGRVAIEPVLLTQMGGVGARAVQISPPEMPLADAMAQTKTLLQQAVRNSF